MNMCIAIQAGLTNVITCGRQLLAAELLFLCRFLRRPVTPFDHDDDNDELEYDDESASESDVPAGAADSGATTATPNN